MLFVTKHRKTYLLLGGGKVGPGYLLIVQGLYWIQMLKYKNVKRNAHNVSPQNLLKRERIFGVEMG